MSKSLILQAEAKKIQRQTQKKAIKNLKNLEGDELGAYLILQAEAKKTQKEAIKNLKNFAKLYCVEICAKKKIN